jgi:hypothetical protein
MKHSAALKVKPGELLALNLNKDGILWEVVSIMFPTFTVQEAGTIYRPKAIGYWYFSKPTKAQFNAYNKRREKYYGNSDSETSTASTSF